MPLRTRPGNLSGDPSGASPATLALAAAAAPTATAAGHPGVHHRVRREGRGARGYRCEVGDHTPRFRRATFRTLRRLVRVAHRAHQVEAILAACALVLVQGHLFPTSRFTDLMAHLLYRPSRPDGSAGAMGVGAAQRFGS